MENQAYYRSLDNGDCNEAITDRPLVVNCSGLCVMNRPFTTHARSGRNDYYLLYMYGGGVEALANGERCSLSAGQCVIFLPNREYKYTKTSAEDVVYYWAHFTGSSAPELVSKLGLSGGVKTVGLSDGVASRFAALFSEFIRRDDYFELSAAALLVSICVALSRRIRDNTRRESPDGSRLSESLLYIHKNLGSELSLSKLASIEHLSPSRYRTLFRRLMGCPPQSYIASLRMMRACELLSQTRLSVKEIGASVGYGDGLYFCRVFKKSTGMPPREYRRRYA